MKTKQVDKIEFAGGNGLELDEYIESDDFKAEMEKLQMPVQIDGGEQTGY